MQRNKALHPLLSLEKLPAVLVAILCHLIAVSTVLTLGACVQPQELPPSVWVLGEGSLAALIAWSIGLPWWWSAINFVIGPLIIWAQRFNIDSSWFLGAFLLLASLFWTTFKSGVPLYLTSASTCRKLEKLLPPGARLLDLGCGFGGLLLQLAHARGDCDFHGREIAPLPAAIARLRARPHSCISVTRGDFWEMEFSRYDVVYAFLSPLPMRALWDKARREMRAGSLLISNTFEIPGVEPDAVIALNDYRCSALRIWRM